MQRRSGISSLLLALAVALPVCCCQGRTLADLLTRPFAADRTTAAPDHGCCRAGDSGDRTPTPNPRPSDGDDHCRCDRIKQAPQSERAFTLTDATLGIVPVPAPALQAVPAAQAQPVALDTGPPPLAPNTLLRLRCALII